MSQLLRLSLPLFSVALLFILTLSGCGTLETGASPQQGRDKTVQLQIFLDSHKFGPGIIDGRRGEFTAKALALYRHSKGLPTDYQPDLSTIAPYRSYT